MGTLICMFNILVDLIERSYFDFAEVSSQNSGGPINIWMSTKCHLVYCWLVPAFWLTVEVRVRGWKGRMSYA